MIDGFTRFELDNIHTLHVGTLPDELRVDSERFDSLWALHPDDYHVIQIHGRPVKTPRWQQAYGADYHHTGQTNVALPIPVDLKPFHGWTRQAIDERLNGLLLNWCDGKLGHYIGPHHDSTKNMVEGAPIVTISLRRNYRTFRLTHPRPTPFFLVDNDVSSQAPLELSPSLLLTHSSLTQK